MRKTLGLALLAVLGFGFTGPGIRAEKLSLKFSYTKHSIQDGDINTWVGAYNTLWQDWQARNGGSLEGAFLPLDYDYNIDIELRIPLFAGLALNMSGSQLKERKQGTVSYADASLNQEESHSLTNAVKAWPFRIGLSYIIPVVPRLNFFFQGGRHIVFVEYTRLEAYDANFTGEDRTFHYWFERTSTFKSEALGYYASIGLEFDLTPYLAVVGEAEKVWTHVDGFKGPSLYEDFEGRNDSDRESLYYYETDQWNLGRTYPLLIGHPERPEDPQIQNLRPGELNFSGISFKMGLRIKF